MKDKIEKCFEYQKFKIQIINKSNQEYDYYADCLKTSEWTKLAPVNTFNWIKWLRRGKKKKIVWFSHQSLIGSKHQKLNGEKKACSKQENKYSKHENGSWK